MLEQFRVVPCEWLRSNGLPPAVQVGRGTAPHSEGPEFSGSMRAIP